PDKTSTSSLPSLSEVTSYPRTVPSPSVGENDWSSEKPTCTSCSEVGVVPVTHGPGHGAPGGMAVLTNGPLTPDSTVGPMGALQPTAMVTGFPTRSTVTLDNMSGSNLQRDSAEPTSMLMTVSTVRDSILGTATETLETLPAINATETRPSPDLPLRETTPEKQDAQTGMEPGSAALSSTAAPSIIPTSAGGDTNTLLVSTEGPSEGPTVSSTFLENTDTSRSTYREYMYSSSTGVTLWPDMASTSSLPSLTEGTSYSRTVPSTSLVSMTGIGITGAQTSTALPPTPGPTESTPPKGGTPSVTSVTEFRTRDSEKLQSSLASTSPPVQETSRPGSPTASDTSTLSPGKFRPAESTANLVSSPVGESSPEPAVYTTPSHTPSATKTRPGGQTDLSFVLITSAPVFSITSTSGALPGIRTEVSQSLTSAEATDLTTIGTNTMSTLPQDFSSLSPVPLSEVTYKAKVMNSNVPGTESLSVILSSKVTDMTFLYPKTTPNQELLGTEGERSTGASPITSSPGLPMSSATIMGGVPNTSGTTTGSTPQVTVPYGVPNEDSERTSGLPLATEGIVNTVTAKMTGDISMAPAEHSTEAQVSSALLLTTSTSSMAFPGQSTIFPSSSTTEARPLTITETETTHTRALSSSTPVTSSGVTPFTENMSSTSPRTGATSLIFSTKIMEIVPLSPVVTLSPEFPSTGAEKSTNAPLTTTSTKAPPFSDTYPGGPLVTSAGSTSMGTTAHSVAGADLEEGSELPLTTLTTETTESTGTGRVIEGITSAPPGLNRADVSSAIPPATNPAEIPKSSEAVTPRDISPSSLWPGVTTVTPVHTGSHSSLAVVTQAELSRTQRPLIITKVSQESDTEFPLSSTATEATKTVTITDSTLILGLEGNQASKGAISVTEASRTYPTLFSPSESPMTHDTSPERETSTGQAPSTWPTEKLPETGTSSVTFVSKMLSEVTASAPQTSIQGFESQSFSTLQDKTALAGTFISPLSKVTASMSRDVETMSNLVPSAASPSSQAETSPPNLVDTTVNEPSQGTGTHSAIHEPPSPSLGLSPASTTPMAWTSTGSPGTTPSLEDSGSASLTTESVRSSRETPTLDITLPLARTQEVWTSASPSPIPMATEGSSARAGTASVSAQAPSTSTLFTSGDAGKFRPAESTANLVSSPVGESSPEPAVYTTPSHTPEQEWDVPWSSILAKATALPITGADTAPYMAEDSVSFNSNNFIWGYL
ncbi:uncharacterized protein LOC144456597, partial [Phascolarctos cinereus]